MAAGMARRDAAEQVPRPVDAAASERGVQGLGGGGAQALVAVGHHQLDAAQAPVGERAQEVGPERLGLKGAGRHARDLAPAVGVHGGGDYHGGAHDPPVLAHLHVGGVGPQAGPLALDRPGEEGAHPRVDLLADAAHLALGDAREAHGPDRVVDGTGRDAVHVGLSDHRRQGALGRAARLRDGREVGALPELGDPEVDPSRPGVPRPLAVAVALVGAGRAAPAVAGAAQPFHLERHRPLGGVGQRLAHQVGGAALLDQLEERHSRLGHRRLRSAGSSFTTRPYTEDRR
jgi:hypothetical protein